MPHVLDPSSQPSTPESVPAYLHQDLASRTWAEKLDVDVSWMLDPFAPVPADYKERTEAETPSIAPQLMPEEAAA